MSAAEHEFRNPSEINYEPNVRDVLERADNPLSVNDIRIELTYQENKITLSEQYSAGDMEEDIEQIINNKLIPEAEEGDLDISKTHMVYTEHPQPAEVEDTETRYRII